MPPATAAIAAPPFHPGLEWIGAPRDPVMERLCAAGPVLVHFWELGQVNAVRTLPYVRAWHERYAPHGLSVVGVHSPRTAVTASAGAVAADVERRGISYPVAVDAQHRLWRDYGCEGWPSLFLWRRGGALAWFHFGEGDYAGTEAAIRELLGTEAQRDVGEPLDPIRETDAPEARVGPPTPEAFPGGRLGAAWEPPEGGGSLKVRYQGGGAAVTADGSGELRARIDGGPEVTVRVDGVALHELAAHGRHGRHELRLEAEPGVRVWAIGFSPGVA